MAVIGTLVPFLLMVTALRHLPAPRVAVVAMLEPVLASVIAWAVHDQSLTATQIAGASCSPRSPGPDPPARAEDSE